MLLNMYRPSHSSRTVRVFGSQPDTGTIGQPEAALLRLLCRNLEALAPPDPFDPLVVNDPAGGRAQKLRDLILNTNYGQTDIPVPAGIVSAGAVRLEK